MPERRRQQRISVEVRKVGAIGLDQPKSADDHHQRYAEDAWLTIATLGILGDTQRIVDR
jgi:hypothetical protein